MEIKVQIADGKGVAGYEFTLSYDQSALEYAIIKNGDQMDHVTYKMQCGLNVRERYINSESKKSD